MHHDRHRSSPGSLRDLHGVAVYELDAPAPPGLEVVCLTNLVGQVALRNVGSLIRASGRVQVTVELSCRRCLAPVAVPLDLQIEDECVLGEVDSLAAYASAAGEAGDPVPILDDDELELGELLRQNVMMNVPEAPLCRPDCAGLCAGCGADLNRGLCTCPPREWDPRWNQLRELLPAQKPLGPRLQPRRHADTQAPLRRRP